MSTYRVRLESKITIRDPYVVKVVHSRTSPIIEFRSLLKSTRTTVGDTWGYANPEEEIIFSTSDGWQTFDTVSYWVFTNEIDALPFMLLIGDIGRRVYVWPSSRKFTIYDYDHSAA